MDAVTQRKHKDVINHFNELYNVKRKRMDDALEETATKFYFRKPKSVYKLIFYNSKNFEYYCSLQRCTKNELQPTG